MKRWLDYGFDILPAALLFALLAGGHSHLVIVH